MHPIFQKGVTQLGRIPEIVYPMELLSLPDASQLAEVSVTMLRNYIRDKRLAAYEEGGRLMVERSELVAVFGPKRLTPPEAGRGTRILAVVNQ